MLNSTLHRTCLQPLTSTPIPSKKKCSPGVPTSSCPKIPTPQKICPNEEKSKISTCIDCILFQRYDRSEARHWIQTTSDDCCPQETSMSDKTLLNSDHNVFPCD